MKNKTLGIISLLLMPLAANVQASDEVKHIPGIFIGATHFDSETEITFGLEYEYKIDHQWGVGAVYEKTSEAHHGEGVSVSLISAFYHPNNNVRLGLGLGQERVGGYHPHTENLYRVSAGYDFHVERFGIAPTVAVDFVDGEEALVFGVAFTRPF
ncbi:hypothetical protein GCM10008107_30660 [Psychrosphaera saromensis]|uniref:Outer membrane protein beta-barrel domain-containing protein n=1 Tax=Psychrosphaera saromensis TaxID=716813 RepID=A0A2S7USH5_9GAMM|nr:hypothetical protein [Psychrosphaera saromensis]PQJ52903.1 hypothetical protein BTO11_04040 [Psychrosphaera saromensis]GHB78960.1 hypothetical protein GCM10008107_30660 [Psychrosphaera saromensis]GLQ14640.1 hypothetical protein GCM10007917_20950 [Psychrosphaera saromensis]